MNPKNSLPETPVISDKLEGDVFSLECRQILASTKDVLESSVIPTDEYSKENDFNNVISVIGERGSGKTSVLFSMAKIINEGVAAQQDVVFNKVYVVFPIIEPRFFTSSNGILQLVISKLFGIFKDLIPQCHGQEEIQRILHQFEETAKAINFEKEAANLPDAIDALDSYSKFFAIRTSLFDLVNSILKLLNQASQKAYKCMLFIIDDIDLDSLCAYRSISQISKYLKIPNLIFYLAYDRETMDNLISRGKGAELFGDAGDSIAFGSNRVVSSAKKVLFIESVRSYQEKLIPERFKCFLSGAPKYFDYFVYIFRSLDQDPKEETDTMKKRYADIIDALRKAASIRHINQCLNLFSDFVYPITEDIDQYRHLPEVLSALYRLAYPDGALENVDTFGEGKSFSDYVLFGNGISGDMQVLYRQAYLINQFLGTKHGSGDNGDFVSYFFGLGLSGNGHDEEILASENQIVGFQDICSYGKMRPLEFFELFSKIFKAKSLVKGSASRIASALALYLPGSLSYTDGKRYVDSVELTDRNVGFVADVTESPDPIASITDILGHNHNLGKAVLSKISFYLTEAVRYGQIPGQNYLIKSIQTSISNALTMRASDQQFIELSRAIRSDLEKMLNA